MVGANYQSAVAAYLQSLLAAGRSKTTIIGERSALKLLGDFAKSNNLDHISVVIPAFLASQHERLSHNSACILSTRVRLFFAYCLRARLLKVNPFDVLPRAHMAYKIVVPLSDTELKRLLTAGDVWDKAIIILLLSTGLRIAELVSLKWTDIHGDTVRVTGKGRKDRLVALGQWGFQIISALPRNSSHIIPLKAVSIQCRLAKLSKRTGIHVHAHLLRHTYADRLRRDGCSLDSIGCALGHASLQTTLLYLRGNQQEVSLAEQRAHNPADALLGEGGNVVPITRINV